MPTFTTFDGLSLHYEDDGEGLPLLCLSGLTRTVRDFDYLKPHLPPLRQIRMDYRGRGQSGWSPDPMSYSVPNEAKDAVLLLDHLGIGKAAVLGTSRGGLIGMFLAATAKDRMLGLALNDIGPVIERAGLERIKDYVGRNPSARSYEDLAAAMPRHNPGFDGVSDTRWREEARLHYRATDQGMKITYDPALRTSVVAGFDAPAPDLWPLFDASAGLPLALIRGANSDLLSAATAVEMRRRRPDMIFAEVPDRAHIPFLDEPESLAAIHSWLELMQ
jgi:pimeloyl-ACP methyl ester carboxylesterase